MALNKAMIAKTKGKMPPPPSAKGEDDKDPMFDLPEDSADADAGAGEPDGDAAAPAGGKGDEAHFQKMLAAVPTDRLKEELARREDEGKGGEGDKASGDDDGDADDAGEAEEYNGDSGSY